MSRYLDRHPRACMCAVLALYLIVLMLDGAP